MQRTALVVHACGSDVEVAADQDLAGAVVQRVADVDLAGGGAGGLHGAAAVEQRACAQVQRAVAGDGAATVVELVACMQHQRVGAGGGERAACGGQGAAVDADALGRGGAVAQVDVLAQHDGGVLARIDLLEDADLFVHHALVAGQRHDFAERFRALQKAIGVAVDAHRRQANFRRHERRFRNAELRGDVAFAHLGVFGAESADFGGGRSGRIGHWARPSSRCVLQFLGLLFPRDFSRWSRGLTGILVFTILTCLLIFIY